MREGANMLNTVIGFLKQYRLYVAAAVLLSAVLKFFGVGWLWALAPIWIGALGFGAVVLFWVVTLGTTRH